MSAQVTGLEPGTPYHTRLVAANVNGSNQAENQLATVGLYHLSGDFGSPGSGDGQLSNPEGVAVNATTGDLYVADTGNHRVVRLDSAGNFVSAWGWGVSDGSPASEVCEAGCRAGIAGSGAGQFESPIFVAVDNSPGPSAGDVYVADTSDNVVQKFDSSGNLVTSWGTDGAISYSGGIAGIAVKSSGALVVEPGSGTGIAVDSFGHVVTGQTGIAVDTSSNDRFDDEGASIQESSADGAPLDFFGVGALTAGAGLAFNQSTHTLYAADSKANTIAVFTPRAIPTVATNPLTNAGPISVTMSGIVEPGTGGAVTECRFEYGTDTTYSLGSVPCSPAGPISAPTNVSAELNGLSPFTTYHFRLAATGEGAAELFSFSRDRTFTTNPGVNPSIDGTSSGSVGRTEATLSAEINPKFAPTTFRFQYGLTSGYGSQTAASQPIGSDDADHDVSTVLNELEPATTYHYRALAVNFSGTTYGPDQTFTTPDVPTVAASVAAEVGQTSAVLMANVRPGFRATAYHFEYGLSSKYGQSTPVSPAGGADDSVHAVSSTVSGLRPSTVYHFRIVATNAVGITNGPDQAFSTAATESTPGPPPPVCKARKHHKCRGHHHHPQHPTHHHRKRRHRQEARG